MLRQNTDTLRHVWTHHGSESQPRGFESSWPLYFPRYDTETVGHAWLELGYQFKVDGVWTVRSYVDGELISELPFNLIDCAGELESLEIPELPEPAIVAADGAAEPPPDPLPEEIVCTREKLTGSNIKQTVCRTVTEIERRRENDQELVRDIQDSPGSNIPK